MDDFKAYTDDMGEEERANHLGKKPLIAPWGMFKTLVFLIFDAIRIGQFQDMWKIFLINERAERSPPKRQHLLKLI